MVLHLISCEPKGPAPQTFQVTCRELVYVDRTYEVEAKDADEASALVEKSCGACNCVDEQMQETHSFISVRTVELVG